MACYARYEGDEVTVGNELIERRWRLVAGALVALSLRELATGFEWIAPGERPSTVPAGWDEGRMESWRVSEGRALPVEAESLRAELTVTGGRAVTYRFKVFPAVAAVELQVVGDPVQTELVDAVPDDEGPTGVEADPGSDRDGADDGDRCERWRLAPHHAELLRCVLQDRTDGHDNLARLERRHLSVAERIELRGVAFAVEDPLSGRGLCLIKQAPLPDVRPATDPVDLRAKGRELELIGHGAGDTGEGYPWTVLCYGGGDAGRARVLQAWQRRLREPRPGLDGVFLTNTWGDRNRDGRIDEGFLVGEVAATAALGGEVQQIDDGWQKGITSNSVEAAKGGVWLGFWAADPAFWTPHPQRLPNGLGPIVRACDEHGVGLGLWFAPDSADDFANHAKDAAVIVDYHRTLGVRWVKIDGVKARTKAGERNLRLFFAQVLRETKGGVCFDLDVTAEVRPGYFGRPEVGTLFVENRYTDWGKYHPHATLRNLWQLSWWVAPWRLRMELLNNQRNAEQYGDDPLAPGCYPADYLFAAVMIASPLGWFEVSQLSDDYVAVVAPLVASWKAHRAELHGGDVIPIGACPSGASWTGFCVDGGDHAHLIVFRELTADDEAAIEVPVDGVWTAERIAGDGELDCADGVAEVEIGGQLRYGWWRLTRG